LLSDKRKHSSRGSWNADGPAAPPNVLLVINGSAYFSANFATAAQRLAAYAESGSSRSPVTSGTPESIHDRNVSHPRTA
jgi:hypothetical protein